MATQSFRGVGYCARMTLAGDWAFDFALDLATRNDVQLDVFFFPTPPSIPHASRGRRGETANLSDEERIQIEKDMRIYYDQMLGDFVNVGFRLCEGDEEPELRRCLMLRREYDVLVLPYEGHHARFGSGSVEEFAESMPCPTVLVGPERAEQYYLNTPAKLWVSRLGLVEGSFHNVCDIEVREKPQD
jgi:hypothetical protein